MGRSLSRLAPLSPGTHSLMAFDFRAHQFHEAFIGVHHLEVGVHHDHTKGNGADQGVGRLLCQTSHVRDAHALLGLAG